MRLQKIIFPAVVVILMITSCTKQKAVFLEPVKDLNALWRINNVTRNETDITHYIDSAGFRLYFRRQRYSFFG
jgi:L-fucose isomerase-like protein